MEGQLIRRVGMVPPPCLHLGLHYNQIDTRWITSGIFAFQSPLLLPSP